MILCTNLVLTISLLIFLISHILFLINDLLLVILLQRAHDLVQLAIPNHGYLRAMNLKRLGAVLWLGRCVLLKLAQRQWRSLSLILGVYSFHHFLKLMFQISGVLS